MYLKVLTGSEVKYRAFRIQEGKPGKPFNRGGGKGGSHGGSSHRYVKLFMGKYMI